MRYITLTNLFMTICIILFLIAFFLDAFTNFDWWLKGPLLVGCGASGIMCYRENGGKFGSY